MLSKCGAGEDSWESLGLQGDQTSQSYRKSTLNIHWKDWWWSWTFNTLASWCKEPTHWKDTDSGKVWGQEEKRATEDETVRWHHQLNRYECEQTLGDSEGNMACCSPWVLQRIRHDLVTEQPVLYTYMHIYLDVHIKIHIIYICIYMPSMYIYIYVYICV